MKMKKVSKSRWAVLVLVLAAIVVLFNVTGCSMLSDQMEKAKGLVGVGSDPVVIETPTCDLSCDEIRG